MKSAGAVYRQYRQVRKLALLRSVSTARQKNHDNCFYGRRVRYIDVDGLMKDVSLCLCKPGNPDACTAAWECNAFVRKWPDDKVAERFTAVMEDDAAKKRVFPELWAYEWVLDKSLAEARKSDGPLSRMLIGMISGLESVLKALNGRKYLGAPGGTDAKA